jgi:RNA-directed DNA polymerase
MSGLIWERNGRRVYFLHRWPSQRSMKRVRARVKGLTGRNRSGVSDVRVIIREVNPVLRGWGGYFRTGNAAEKFNRVDRYVVRRLQGLLRKRKGRNLRPGDLDGWTREYFERHGLYRLRGTVQYPETPFWRIAQ